MRTPTWSEIEEFLRRDGWTQVGATDHKIWRKALPDGTLLETRTSFAGQKTMSEGRFLTILKVQLRVNQRDFWETLRTGEPVPRPSQPIAEQPAEYDAWVVDALVYQMGLRPDEITALSPDEARNKVLDFWSRPAG